jgi:hypothetical protein
MMLNIFPHGKVNGPLEAAFVENPGTHASVPSGVLSHPGFRRSQSGRGGQHEPTSRRLWFAGKFILRYGTVGDRLAGLALVEFAELPDKPP